MKMTHFLIPALAIAVLCGPRVTFAQTNVPEAKITMQTIFVHSPRGFTLVPEEAKTIMLSSEFVGATVDVLGLTNQWGISKSKACERIARSLQVERSTDRYHAVVRMVEVDPQDAVNIINELCFMIANCRATGKPSTEEEMKSLAATNCTPAYLYRRTEEIGRTNTAVVVVNEYAKEIESNIGQVSSDAAPCK